MWLYKVYKFLATPNVMAQYKKRDGDEHIENPFFRHEETMRQPVGSWTKEDQEALNALRQKKANQLQPLMDYIDTEMNSAYNPELLAVALTKDAHTIRELLYPFDDNPLG